MDPTSKARGYTPARDNGKEMTMSQTMIEKAREQRLKALQQVRQKPFFSSMEFVDDIKNVFDTSDHGHCESNVIRFRNHRATQHKTDQAVLRLY